MVNLNGFQNISPINLNTTVVTSNNVIEDSKNIFITNVPYWLMPVTIILFIVMVWFIYKKLNWNLDIIQSSLIAAFFQILTSYAFLKAGWTISAVPLGFWGTIWMILLMAMFYIKKR